MRAIATVGVAAGSLTLILAGCSSTTSDENSSESNNPDATENAAVGDIPSQIKLACEGKVKTITLTDDMTSVQVEAVGAKGAMNNGGTGGAVSASIPIDKGSMGTTIYAKVGCSGGQPPKGAAKGWPNGGGGVVPGGGSTSLETIENQFSAFIIAGGGGGGTSGNDYPGGSVKADGSGEDGTGHSCGGKGATQSAAGTTTGKKGVKGKNGQKGSGGRGGVGSYKVNGGGGGGGWYGGAGGCGQKTWDNMHGSGGGGSSWADPSFNPKYSTGKSVDGSLGLTFLCGDDACATQPTPK